MTRRRLLSALLGLCALAALCPSQALAQATRVVVPGPPGGFADIVLRLLAERLQQGLGHSVVIEHRPGAGGTVGLEYLRTARADGLTLGMINLSASANETLIKGKSYSLLSDFEPIGHYAWLANVLIVHPSVPAQNIADLVEVLKARANANYSSGGVGSPGHLIAELFKARTGVGMTHVPYKGAPPAVTAVVTGEVSLMFATASAVMSHVSSARVRALAVTVGERLPQLPEVPTLEQGGLANLNVTDWVGLVAPRGTPLEARERIHRAFAAAFADPVAGERLRNATIIPAAQPLGPTDFGGFLRREVDKWARVVHEAKIAPN